MNNSLSALKSMQKQPAPTIQEVEAKTDEFFKKSDLDGDKKITLSEFKAYISKDKAILEVLMGAGVAKKEDLGMDFGGGNGKVPDCDPDLERECNPKELLKTNNNKQIVKGAQKPKDEFFEAEDVD